MDKKLIDLFEGATLEGKDYKKLHDEIIGEQPKPKKQLELMPIIMSLMTNPKKIKHILIGVGISSIIGIFTTIYFIITQLINLVNYLITNL